MRVIEKGKALLRVMRASSFEVLLRSGSLEFTDDTLSRVTPGRAKEMSWRGYNLAYRPGSSDIWMVYENIMRDPKKNEYFPPEEFTLPHNQVKTVLDIGGNIGLTALFFSKIFQNARIYAFEPVKDNFEILSKNIKNCDRIFGVNCGLGSSDQKIEIYSNENPANFGGFSLYEARSDTGPTQTITIRKAANEISRLGIASADVIKIDTEGAEWDIITTFPKSFLQQTMLIIGELHGHKDFALLEYLSDTFSIGLRKKINKPNFCFSAVNRVVLGR